MSEPKFGTWTPTSEQLPEPDTYVLAYSEYFETGCFVLCNDGDGGWHDEECDNWRSNREIVAWMPLPEPYREAGEVE